MDRQSAPMSLCEPVGFECGSARSRRVAAPARHVARLLARRTRVHERGRICAYEGCATILSVYDPAKRCADHMMRAANPQRMQLAALWASPTEREVPDDAA